MASIRHQRRAERKRGAANHSNQHVDFALTFPPVIAPISDSIYKPADSQPLPSIAHQDATESLPLDTLRQAQPSSSEAVAKISANTSAKRQRLQVDSAVQSSQDTPAALHTPQVDSAAHSHNLTTSINDIVPARLVQSAKRRKLTPTSHSRLNEHVLIDTLNSTQGTSEATTATASPKSPAPSAYRRNTGLFSQSDRNRSSTSVDSQNSHEDITLHISRTSQHQFPTGSIVNHRNRQAVTAHKPSTIRKQPQSRKLDEAKTKKRRKYEPRDAIIIPVRRFTKPLALVDDSDTDADILNLPISFSKRAGINTVDVLAKLSEETISSYLAASKEQVVHAKSSATKRDTIVKLQAVEKWGRTLATGFCDQTNNLDENYRLQRCLRSSTRVLKRLRADVLRIRRQREEVAISMDLVRAQHEQDSNAHLAQQTLQTNTDDVQMSLDSFTAAQNQTCHSTLSRGLRTLTFTYDGGGIMQRVTSFNAFLERSAMILESSI